ncbi:MAG: hypothetical protein JST62_07895 [Bacteroidetes bacterium]|nr:hypothetical protein [Bacteroidota bacterium]
MKSNFSISILVFLLMICNATYPAQNNSNEKPKRTYTQKTNNTNVETTTATKPTRTYTTKENTTSTTPTPKPTRTYTTNPNKDTKSPQKTIPANNTSVQNNNVPKKEISEERKPAEESFWTKWFGKKSNNTSVKTTELYKGHPVYKGPKGGKYYINKNGNKTYIK